MLYKVLPIIVFLYFTYIIILAYVWNFFTDHSHPKRMVTCKYFKFSLYTFLYSSLGKQYNEQFIWLIVLVQNEEGSNYLHYLLGREG